MNFLRPLSLLLVLFLLARGPLFAQATDDLNPETPPPGDTVITSDELHSDDNTHISIFTGNVVVLGTNFKMTCQEMTVYFTPQNKVMKIVAVGNVVVVQPNRVTHCGHAEYYHDEDKFDLTDQPVILDPKGKISAPEIILMRTTQEMITKGGHSRVDLVSKSAPKPAPAKTPPAPPTSTDSK
jgi:lipopolysaccharide export system protein LptA